MVLTISLASLGTSLTGMMDFVLFIAQVFRQVYYDLSQVVVQKALLKQPLWMLTVYLCQQLDAEKRGT